MIEKPRAAALRKRWDSGDLVRATWLTIANSYSAEIMAAAGWDALVIDLQHGVVDYQAAVTMLQALATKPVIPMARVPWNHAPDIMRVLDAGVAGVICPMINDGEACKAFVGACRYAPDGYRSVGPNRLLIDQEVATPDYVAQGRDPVVAIAMVETRDAIDNLDDILATPGLDAVYVGPSDLAVSLGLSPQADPTHKEVLAAMDKVVARAKAHGIAVGCHVGSAEGALAMADRGFRFVTVANDAQLMAQAAARTLGTLSK